MPEAKDVSEAMTSLLINAGVGGGIAIITLLGFGWIVYSIGKKFVDVADRFVTGTLQFQLSLVEKFDEQTEKQALSFSAITKTQIEIQSHQEKLADRLDLALRNKR